MGEQLRATRPLNEDAVRAANAAVGGKKLGTGPEDGDLREKWMEAYVAAGGKAVPVVPKGRSPGGAVCACPDKPILTVTLVSVTFTTDHGLLTDKYTSSEDRKDALDRWMPGGKKYSERDPKEWTRDHNFSISQTKNTMLSIIAEFEAGPADAAPASGSITGTSERWTFLGRATFRPTNSAKTNTIKVPMKGDLLPEEIQRLDETLKWEIDIGGRTFTARSGPHTVYVTYDTPRAVGDRQDIDLDTGEISFRPQPLGITLKRMDKAVELVEPRDTTEPIFRTIHEFDPANPKTLKGVDVELNRPHAIVYKLMRMFKDYELNPDVTLAEFSHPVYMNSGRGGSWGIADYIKESAECQAIVRFVTNIINQLGVPGKAETIYVFAKPENPTVGEESENRNGYKKHALVDRELKDSDVGKVFPPSHSKLPDGKTTMGFNQYEACMRFTYEKLTAYYGGGAGVYKDKHAVLRAFQAMVEIEPAWYPNPTDPKKKPGLKITKILARYK